jgi:hypothetical protein
VNVSVVEEVQDTVLLVQHVVEKLGSAFSPIKRWVLRETRHGVEHENHPS